MKALLITTALAALFGGETPCTQSQTPACSKIAQTCTESTLAAARAGGDKQAAEQQACAADCSYDCCAELNAEESAKLAALTERLLRTGEPCGPEECEGGCTTACEAWADNRDISYLVKFVNKRPPAWNVLGSTLAKSALDEATPEVVRTRVIDFLAHERSKKSVELASVVLAKKPQAFDQDQLLSFSEVGATAFREALSSCAQEGAVLPAAYLVASNNACTEACKDGCPEGCAWLPVVERTRQPSFTSAEIVPTFAAAAVVGGMTKDDTFKRTMMAAQMDILKVLDSGDFELARDLALAVEAMQNECSSGKLKFSYMQSRVQGHVAKRAAQIETPQQVFELLERLNQQC